MLLHVPSCKTTGVENEWVVHILCHFSKLLREIFGRPFVLNLSAPFLTSACTSLLYGVCLFYIIMLVMYRSNDNIQYYYQ